MVKSVTLKGPRSKAQIPDAKWVSDTGDSSGCMGCDESLWRLVGSERDVAAIQTITEAAGKVNCCSSTKLVPSSMTRFPGHLSAVMKARARTCPSRHPVLPRDNPRRKVGTWVEGRTKPHGSRFAGKRPRGKRTRAR